MGAVRVPGWVPVTLNLISLEPTSAAGCVHARHLAVHCVSSATHRHPTGPVRTSRSTRSVGRGVAAK